MYIIVKDVKKKKKFSVLVYKSYGLVSACSGYISSTSLEAVRKLVVRAFRVSFYRKLQPKFLVRVFSYMSLTSKPIEVRMGRGKGDHSSWVCPIKKGQIIFELNGLTFFLAYPILRMVLAKLSVKCRIISF